MHVVTIKPRPGFHITEISTQCHVLASQLPLFNVQFNDVQNFAALMRHVSTFSCYALVLLLDSNRPDYLL